MAEPGYNDNKGAVPQQSKFKQHFRKYWWAHLLNFVIGTLLLSLLLTYVGLPRIAQGDVDKAEMIINEQEVSMTTPTSFQLRVLSTVKSKSLFTPQLDGFEASLFLEDTEPNIKPFAKINIPPVHATKVSTTIVNQHVEILDQEQFKRYNILVATAKHFRMGLRGRTKLHLGALPVTTVDFNKAPELDGLNKLSGIEVSNINVSLTKFPDGSNMQGRIMIPNPSVMTLEIGDLVQDISSNGTPIGNTTINNVVLRPGKNYFEMASSSDQAAVITILSADKTKSGILPITAKTISVTNKAGQHLPYFEAAMVRISCTIS
ncbi:hypothetical protein BT63DRAFT_420503 [Microthyrium microscopicum]|uniref:Uncharacterized protein n=1 Tax=Microthyrium microscopicum TaxID=703497 RepID=A0A6A6UTZ2_9PEZI|nr:hypothetical protein BT63DRAFT_420503 [Microthyrium microscopicum]